jgi:hypothetical protein
MAAAYTSGAGVLPASPAGDLKGRSGTNPLALTAASGGQQCRYVMPQIVPRCSRLVVIVISTDMTQCGHHYRLRPPAGLAEAAFG